METRADRHEVEFACGTVVWRRIGSGKPLVLVHGGHGSWLHWVRNAEALAARRTVWIVDLPGYGDSDLPCAPDLDRLVEGLVLTLDAAVGAGSRVDMAGFSFGGLVAAHAATRRGNIGRLALLGPVGHGTARRSKHDLVNWKGATGAELEERMRHNLAAQMLHAAEAVDDLAVWIHTWSCLRSRFHSRVFSRGDSLLKKIGAFGGETLLVWGEHDVTGDPHALSGNVAANHPNCRAQIVPNAGHWVQYEAADAVNELLCDWFAGQGDGSGEPKGELS